MQEKSLRNTLIIAVVGYLIYTLKNVLSPFLIALFLAYLINPLITLIHQKLRLKKRGLSITLGLFFSASIIIGVILLSLPTLNKEISQRCNSYKRTCRHHPSYSIRATRASESISTLQSG